MRIYNLLLISTLPVLPKMGRPTGLEPATPRFTILCSNQLSYDRRKGSANLTSAPGAVNPFFGMCSTHFPGRVSR